ncbi:hypothetical protein LINPERHAP2_LOCUS41231, partial [Linum perenne]
ILLPTFVNQTLEKPIELSKNSPHPFLHSLQINNPSQHRKKIRRIRCPAQLKHFTYHILKPLPFILSFFLFSPEISLPGDHPHHYIHRQTRQSRLHLHQITRPGPGPA